MRTLLPRLLFIAGLGCLILGGSDVSLLLRGTATPEETTAKTLGSEEGIRNVHLTVKEFQFGSRVVIEKDDDGKWKRVWIPVLTPYGKWTPRPIVIHTSQISNREELEQFLNRDQVTGFISNGIQGLGRYQQQ